METPERSAAAHGVTQPVAEGADAGARHVGLGCVSAAGVIGNLAEVPSLAVEIDLGPVHPILLRSQPGKQVTRFDHVGDHVVAHQVEAKPIHLVRRGPGSERVEHQLFHHGVLARRILAAGARLYLARGVQPVVVAWNDPIQHRLRALAAGVGVVVHHVHHHAQPGLAQSHDHFPKLPDACRAVGVGGIASLRRGEMVRVVAPVESVLVA